jgi:hypothetical protein
MTKEYDAFYDSLLSAVLLSVVAEMAWARCFKEARKLAEREGMAIGRQEGAANGLRKVLTLRFGPLPPEIAAKIDGASVEQIHVWAERILPAETLEEIFCPERPATPGVRAAPAGAPMLPAPFS